MKKINIFILALTAVTALNISCTQEKKPTESKPVSKAEPIPEKTKELPKLEVQLFSYLEKIGVLRDGKIYEGNYENGFFSYGLSDIETSSNAKDFQEKRIEAFKQAIMAAKFNILNRRFALMSKAEANYYKDATILFKQNADRPFFKEALSLNLPENTEKSFFKETPTSLNFVSLNITKNFKDLLKDDCYASYSQLADTLKGIFSMKSFEDENSVAVVLFTGADTEYYADCMLGKCEYSPDEVKSKITIKEKVDAYSLSELYALNLSCSIVLDKNGDIAILSFGQAVINNNMEESISRARELAMRNINNFAGSSFLTESILVGNNANDIYSFKLQKKEIFKENNINGVEELRQWKAKDEVSNTEICGVVLALELKNLKAK